jgi:outer membrane lipoprotein SlyB
LLQSHGRTADGRVVGRTEGTPLGSAVGSTVGGAEGYRVGTSVGSSVECMLGCMHKRVMVRMCRNLPSGLNVRQTTGTTLH